MDQGLRNKLRNVVTQCRKLLEDAVAQVLQGQFGIYATGKKDEVHVEDESRMTNLVVQEDRVCRRDLLDHFEHIQALGYKPKDALAQLVRETAFTHLNRLCAYKMMEARGVVINGRPFREAVSRGLKSQGFLFYVAEHSADEKLYNSGHQDVAYRHFLDWLGGTLSEEIGVLFSPNDPANRLYPPQRVLDKVLDLINTGDIKPDEKELQETWPTIWCADETIGWVYQYFTPKELRDQARKESAAPRNSYELAFRNQFFTPRYVVEFLTDNTLGRIWNEMRKGQTRLKDQCHYMVRRPNEVFLAKGQVPPSDSPLAPGGRGAGGEGAQDDLSQEELLKLPAFVPYRPKKDPRELRILDPACGSGHFLLYCFDLLETIYEEAYDDPDLGPALKRDYPTRNDLRPAVPGLILAHNLHGIDIDLRATQIAALALWLRCHRAYQERAIKKDRPRITRSNIVCAEPMPGEKQLLEDFLKTLQQDRLETLIQRVMQVPEGTRVRATQSMVDSLCELVRLVWEKMRLAGEAGSLLKIEDELQEAVRVGQEEWEEKHPLFRVTEFSLTKQPKESYLRFVPGEGVSFWQQAERLVMAALHDFAAFAGNGHQLQRRLFADDALRGFAFVDVCRNRFDTILMNPPFGLYPESVKVYLAETYPNGKADIAASCVQRAQWLLANRGLVGVITTRTLLVLPTFEEWRLHTLLLKNQVACLADLGYGVLDEAVVEAAAYVAAATGGESAYICSCLESIDKQVSLLDAVSACLRGIHHSSNSFRAPREFACLPAAVVAHQIPSRFARRIGSWKSLESLGASARKGLNTSDDERFLRTAWEVAPSTIGPERRWVFFAKGGEWNPFWDDIYLLVDWADEGRPLVEAGGTIRNPSTYFLPGLTYPQRTTSSFGPRILPASCIFSTGGMAIHFASDEQALCFLGLLLSRPGQLLVEMSVGCGDSSTPGTAARNYTNGMVNRLPFPKIADEAQNTIIRATARAVELVRLNFSHDETARTFTSPFGRVVGSLRKMAAGEQFARLERLSELAPLIHALETECQVALGLAGEEDEKVLAAVVGPSACASTSSASSEEIERWAGESELDLVSALRTKLGRGARYVTKNCQLLDRRLELIAHLSGASVLEVISTLRRSEPRASAEELRAFAASILSYAIGAIFGRWDVCIVAAQRKPHDLSDLFDALPVCSPGMLMGVDRLPACESPHDYPLHVVWDGILVDESEHLGDVVRRVREVFEAIWKDEADTIEQETCEILGVKELREHFRKPSKGGFWDDHVSRYSKSRRKAPIYWLLQSAKKNYALWLYYHRLDKDILFKALVNYVEPKIRLEENRLESLRGQKGSGGKESKKLDKDIEKQETFLSELRDFEDKLRRAANLHLEPDLDDGVVLNIAPLWELVPWRDAKDYWEELLEGKYEWSSIGKQLREKGLVE